MRSAFAVISAVSVLCLFASISPAATTCYVVMEGASVTNYYERLAEAVWAIGTGTGTVTMIANDVITATNAAQRVDVDGCVTIVSDGGDYVIMRGGAGSYENYSMLYVGKINLNTNAVLILGAPGMAGTLTFDGGSFLNFGSSIIQNYRGTLHMHDGIILQNNITEYGGGGVYNEGIFNMYGGLIVSNLAYGTGGGVQNAGYYGREAVFNMYDGAITANKSLNGTYEWGGYGGGVANEGAAVFNMYGGMIDGNEAEFAGGGVNNTQEIQSGTPIAQFNMTGGVISGNTVAGENGLGAGVYNDYVMTIEGDAVITGDNDVYLNNTVITVTGELAGGGVAAALTSNNMDGGTPLVEVAAGAGVTLAEAIESFVLDSPFGDLLVVDSATGEIVIGTPFQYWLQRRQGQDLDDPDFAAEADMDGDGSDTWSEYLADTNPADGGSVLKTSGYALAPDQVLTFPGSTNRMYSLFCKSDLDDADWTPVVLDVQGTNTTMSLADPAVRTRVFYRVEAKLLP